MARFKKLPKSGNHYFRRAGQMIRVRPGDIVEAERHELGNAISTYECLDPLPPEPEEVRTLVARHAGGGRYNIINTVTGKKINDKTLSKEDAKLFIDDYVKDEPE